METTDKTIIKTLLKRLGVKIKKLYSPGEIMTEENNPTGENPDEQTPPTTEAEAINEAVNQTPEPKEEIPINTKIKKFLEKKHKGAKLINIDEKDGSFQYTENGDMKKGFFGLLK